MKKVLSLILLVAAAALGPRPAPAVDESICNEGAEIFTYPQGQLQSCILKDFYSAGSVPCNQFSPITFYESGALKRCVLSDFYYYGDIVCNQYGAIAFFRSGKLQRCLLRDQLAIQGKSCNQFEAITLSRMAGSSPAVSPRKSGKAGRPLRRAPPRGGGPRLNTPSRSSVGLKQ